MTVAMLLKNTFDQAVKRRVKVINIFIQIIKVQTMTGAKWSMKYLSLNPIVPTPPDVAISRSQQPKRIERLAEEVRI